MARCKDNSVSTLNKLGYNVVRYPKPGILPLDIVIEYSKKFELVTSLLKIWESEYEIPEILKEPIPSLDVIETNQLNGSVGLGVLSDIFKTKLNISGIRDKSIKLIVQNPQRIYCNINDIANFIRQGDIISNDAISEQFIDDKRTVYVITEVLATSNLKILISGKSSAEANASASDLSNQISGSLKGSTSKSNENEILFQSDDHLVTFGFKQAEITYEGKWILDLPKKAGKAFLGKSSSENPNYQLLGTNTRIVF